MKKQNNGETASPPNTDKILELLLDVLLEVMQAEAGSIMLLGDDKKNLTIRNARGLKKDIIEKTRVRLGSSISGKVLSGGQAVFLKGISGEHRLNIDSSDMINPCIDTSYILPIKLVDGTPGTININSTKPDHSIRAEKELLVQNIIRCFSEYLTHAELPACHHETPSQLYMMNIFREYNTLRELRVVFDHIFNMVAEILKLEKKGFFLLKNKESGFLDLLLGYGLDKKMYMETYEELMPRLKKTQIESIHNISIFNRKEVFPNSAKFFNEEFCMAIPFIYNDIPNGMLFLFVDKQPKLEETVKNLIISICKSVAKTIERSASVQKFYELSFTDSLTGMYNYGLWWKRLNEELSRAKRSKDSIVSLIVFDIDHLDRFNNKHGYLTGDYLLRFIADRIKSRLRVSDIAGRIGGDEFGVILPGIGKQGSIKVADRILKAVSEIPDEIRIKILRPLTLSGGLVEFSDDEDNSETLVEKAKNALVSAKIMGGNCIKSFERFEE